jgi:hypothetical protein
VNSFKFFIDYDYKYTLYLDDLPSAVIMRDKNNRDLAPNFFDGIPVGYYETDEITGIRRYALYNHFDIVVIIHHTVENHQRVVGFEVEPYSFKEGPTRSPLPADNTAGPQWIEQGLSYV